MAAPTIIRGEEHFFTTLYEGNGGGQRVGKFVPFTDNGTIANSCIFDEASSAYLSKTFSGDGDKQKFTFSMWIKRGNIGSRMDFVSFKQDVPLIFNADNTLYVYLFGANALTTNRTFEDTSKWYNIVLSVDSTNSTADDRVRLYVDGDQITSFSTRNNPSLNASANIYTSTREFMFGNIVGGSYYTDAYFAEVNYIDGTALTPSTFGLTDTSTGRWIPKTLTGITYGTNGFRLKFQDSSALGDDTSGNGNDLTATNLASTDQTTSSPTQNYNTFGSFASGTSATEGNLTISTGTTNGDTQCVGQAGFGVATGKWYWEAKITTVGAGLYGWKDDANAGGSQAVNTSSNGTHSTNNSAGMLSTAASGSFSSGSWFIDGGYGDEVNYTTVSTNDVLMFAIDLDTGKGYCGKNGTWFNSANPANGTGEIGGCHFANGINKFYPMARRLDSNSVAEYNFGQRSFAHTPPTGFSALQQDNLPETAKGVSGFVWVKNRDSASFNHVLYDSSRGVHNYLNSNTTGAEGTDSDGLTKFLKGGFATEDAGYTNTSGNSFVGWNWVANGGTTASSTNSTVQVNSTSKFSIVQYNGTGSDQTIGHGLGVTPDTIWVKCITENSATGSGVSWRIWQKDVISLSSDANSYLRFDSDDSHTAGGDSWGDTAPTSSVFTVGADVHTNASVSGGTAQYIAYCFANVDGYFKTGKYVGNSSSDGSFIYLGFKPAFLMVKAYNLGSDFQIWDNARSPINPITNKALFPDLTNAEGGTHTLDLLSNGFKLRSTENWVNSSSYTYVYWAFAEHPFVGDGTNPVTAR